MVGMLDCEVEWGAAVALAYSFMGLTEEKRSTPGIRGLCDLFGHKQSIEQIKILMSDIRRKVKSSLNLVQWRGKVMCVPNVMEILPRVKTIIYLKTTNVKEKVTELPNSLREIVNVCTTFIQTFVYIKMLISEKSDRVAALKPEDR